MSATHLTIQQLEQCDWHWGLIRNGGGPLTLPELIAIKNNPAVIAAFAVDSWVKASGAVIHLVTSAQAAHIDALISEYGTLFVNRPMLAAWICGESLFDAQAINPNNQEAEKKPNVFERTDYGLVQIDGLYMSGHPGMAGLTQDEMIAKALDPEWAIKDLVATAEGLLAWSLTLSKEQLRDYAPRVVAFNAYNEGREGTLDAIARGDALLYGKNLAARVDQFAALLKPQGGTPIL
jgi:hypothetical protein